MAPAVVFLPNKRALRPAQHFDMIQVQQVEIRHAGAVEIDAVDIKADAGRQPVRRRIVAQPANGERGLARIGRIDHQARRLELQLLDLRGAVGVQIVAADGGDGNGNILDIFRALARRHGDGFQPAIGVGIKMSVLRQDRRGARPGQADHGGRTQQQKTQMTRCYRKPNMISLKTKPVAFAVRAFFRTALSARGRCYNY